MPKWINRVVAAAIILAASPLAAPQLLAFPYTAKIAGHWVYSEETIDTRLAEIVTTADGMVASSPLGSARAADQPIFITNGGWRWNWLAVPSRAAFAVSRPYSETIVVNRSDFNRDLVENGLALGGSRKLGGTLAHEMTHGSIRAHFGLFADWLYPADLREGYCDHVAGGGSLTDAKARILEARDIDIPGLDYWRARKKVQATLAANGGSVDALFANWRS